MMNKLLNLHDTILFLNVSKSTLHRWDKNNKLKPIKTVGGHRRYKLTDLKKFIGEIDDNNENITAIYSRCLTSNQKTHVDFDRQLQFNLEYCVNNNYKIEHVIKDIGSDLNDKHSGFMKLCDLVIQKKINKVVIENKDILTCFQFNLIEKFFESYDVNIEISTEKDFIDHND